jgi:hypothetical protein
MVRLDGARAVPATANTLERPARRAERARAAPTDRHKRGLYRYCSGCARETEHIGSAQGGRGSIPSIRWPAAEPAAGTTTCMNCGQWRMGVGFAGGLFALAIPLAVFKRRGRL